MFLHVRLFHVSPSDCGAQAAGPVGGEAEEGHGHAPGVYS